MTAACYLPLSSKEGLSKEYGTRHRAGIGISERCDTWVLVVSEERGEVSLVREGRIELIENPDKLSRLLAGLATPKKRKEQTGWDKHIWTGDRWMALSGRPTGFCGELSDPCSS